MGNHIKRKKTFRYLREYKVDVCCLQELHGENKSNTLWASEWGCKAIFANGTSNARGVGILLSKKPHKSVREIRRDMEGRYILCKLEINDKEYCIANIYAPNYDDPEFFTKVNDEINDLNCVYCIWAGDFNLVLDPKVDRSKDTLYNRNATKTVKDIMENEGLTDIWRLWNNEKCSFTRCRKRPNLTWSRIDLLLVSQGFASNVSECRIEPFVLSDHSMVYVDVTIEKNKRGPGVWKFNNSLLSNEEFCNKLKEVIRGTVRVYYYLNAIELWEMIKQEIRNFGRDFSKTKAREDKEYNFQLYKILSNMQDEMIKDPNNEQFSKNIDKVQCEIDSYMEQDARKAAFRCKVDWNTYGGKPSSYFLNMEKRNYVNKSMYRVRKADGSIKKDYSEILNVQYDFYKKLYTSNDNVHFNLSNSTGVALNSVDKSRLDGDVSIEELYDGMMTLKTGKCPGSDGISIEVYRRFWTELREPLFNMYQLAEARGLLNPSGRRGIINLIPKCNKCDYLVNHWRPVTLLNGDFKIWAKTIANRLEEVAENLIGKQQYGFMKGRNIQCNIRRTLEVVTFLNRSSSPGVVAMVDFEKCFNRVEYKSIKGVFKYFNFGEAFIDKMFLLFNGFEMCTQNSGFLSDIFNKTRGVNQGCPASPLIYNFCGEIMAHLLINNTNIKGIDMYGITNLLSQFADDTGAYLNFDPITINTFGEVLRTVEATLGLKVSYEKTLLYRVGSLAGTNARIYTTTAFSWSNSPIETLGVFIGCKGEKIQKNDEIVLDKIRKVCSDWKNRTLNVYSKVTVVNSLISSLLVYKMSMLADMSPQEIGEAEKLIYDFMWNGKRARISMETLCKKKQQGGLKLVNLKKKQVALRISWIFKLENDPLLAKCAYTLLSPVLDVTIWKCNLKHSDVPKLFQKCFWREVLSDWCQYNFVEPCNNSDILNQIIWANSCIKINNTPVIWEKWIRKNILFVSDILDENGDIRSGDEEVGTWAANNGEWLNLRSLLDAIPSCWKIQLRTENSEQKGDSYKYDVLRKSKQISQTVYNTLIEDEMYILRYASRLKEKNVSIPDELYKAAFKNVYVCTSTVKYCDFQYRKYMIKLSLMQTYTYGERDQMIFVHFAVITRKP